MTDDRIKKSKTTNDQSFATNVTERSVNPNRNASDLMGDPSSMIGWTVGSAPDTSAESTEQQPSIENLLERIEDTKASHTSSDIPKGAVSDKEYNYNLWKGMSQKAGYDSSGRASERDSDSDTLLNAHAVGMQLNETSDNPEELDIRRDIDAAEEFHRIH